MSKTTIPMAWLFAGFCGFFLFSNAFVWLITKFSWYDLIYSPFSVFNFIVGLVVGVCLAAQADETLKKNN